jgi:hypothetical protein
MRKRKYMLYAENRANDNVHHLVLRGVVIAVKNGHMTTTHVLPVGKSVASVAS